MLPSQIIQIARDQTDTPLSILTQDQAYQYLNIVVNDFWRDISNESVWDKMTTWNLNLTAGTSTYTLPSSIAASTLLTSTFGINQLVKAGIKYKSADQYYTPIQVKYVEWYLNMPDYYANQNLKGNPTAYLIDTESIVIAPTPTESITNGLQIMGPVATVALSTTTEDIEGMIPISSTAHPVIVEWLKYWFYGKRGSDFVPLAMGSKQLYESEKLRVINQLMNKNQLADECFTLDLSYFG
jgi:hypothetical protein